MTKYLKYEPPTQKKNKTKTKAKQKQKNKQTYKAKKNKKTLAQQISLTEGNTLGMNKTAMIDR